ncbi:unnamed protein product [Cercospora beticola]|nr:unnamed protein product [Cercospora beticola]
MRTAEYVHVFAVRLAYFGSWVESAPFRDLIFDWVGVQLRSCYGDISCRNRESGQHVRDGPSIPGKRCSESSSSTAVEASEQSNCCASERDDCRNGDNPPG